MSATAGGPLRELGAWLARYREVWESSPGKLEQHLDDMRPQDRVWRAITEPEHLWA